MTVPGDCVVDASVALKWVLEEQGSAEAAMLLDGRAIFAPSLVDTEAANALWAAARRGEVSRGEAALVFDTFLAAPLRRIDLSADLTASALQIAADLDHPVYDCVYLAAGLMLDLPVVTADRRFLVAARRNAELARSVALLGVA
ncbi:MAG: type II toxin-antitoxin system VapC family toxin [Paracoccaceae bacterium]